MKITLRKMKLANNRHALFLDITNKGRRREYLKLYIFTKPKNFLDKKHNEETLRQAEALRAQRQLELQADVHGLDSKERQKLDFLKYFQKRVDEYSQADFKKMIASITHFKAFLKERDIYVLPGRHLTKLLCEDFGQYLKAKLEQETARAYMQKFKMVLDRAFEEKISPINRAGFKMKFKVDKDAIKKPMLDPDEIKKMLAAECPGSPVIRRAYLFSLNTGFDFATVSNLYGWMVDKDRLVFDRGKTDSQNSFPLNKTALALIGEIKDPKEKIFNLPTWSTCVAKIRKWAENAGIDKKITWHSARHSFATNLYSDYDTDILAISHLLGHKNVTVTQRYTKVKDKKKRDAVNRMPDMEI